MMSRVAAIGGLTIALTMLLCELAWAAAGTVTHLSGTLAVTRPDGSARILSRRSGVNAGDLLSTQRDSYAQIDFTDGSTMTLRPNTQLRIEDYRFAEDRPQEDSSFFRLLKGGLRTITGLIGKRGNQDAYRIGTSTATIGIRGSSGDTLECTEGCEGVTVDSERLAPGLYHATYTGSYILSNEAGTILVEENQIGFVRDSASAPQLLPQDPGLNFQVLPFALPGRGGPQRSGGQECVVR